MSAASWFRRAGQRLAPLGSRVEPYLPRGGSPAMRWMLVLMIVAGVILRIQGVGSLATFGFDEHQYAGAAHQFLIGVTDSAECCHPPLSKLLIAVGMALFGNNGLGWRFMPLCFGIQNIVLVFLIARSLFKDARAGWFAAAFMAADGFYLSYSRASLPDIILAGFVLWSILAAVSARSLRGVLACAVLVGLSASIKWVGILVGIPCCLALLLLRRVPWYSLAAFVVVPFVHLGVWALGLYLIGHPNYPHAVWEEMQRRANFHLGFVHHTNPLESVWYTWLAMYHPILIKSARAGDELRVASSLGNVVLWIAGDAMLLVLPVAGALAVFRREARARWEAWFDGDSTKGVIILLVAWTSMMLLWFTQRIVTYWYHYLTPWGILLTLLGGLAYRLEKRSPRAALWLVAGVFVIFVYMAPVWAELPLSRMGVAARLPFPLWR